ncbi:hypothetical protein [Cellulomonas sp. KRMCY2]|uniref:hypothetical protein n=1 Tax=Cellulomonas sp. KRMCY2 TaxID=1304865 RepID=UPI00045EC17F|nr:hypothetical protein [Cellulomonas sp. KRMCY2]
MSFNLEQGLHDLGDAPDVRSATVAVDTVLHRVHRQRVVRGTTYGVVGTGAVTAMAFGGLALAQHDRQTPVEPVVVPTPTVTVTPTPTTTPTPGPSPTPSTTPSTAAGSWQLEWDRCGVDMKDAPLLWDRSDYYWRPAAEGAEAAVGGPATGTIALLKSGWSEHVDARVVNGFVVQTDKATGARPVVGVVSAAPQGQASGETDVDGLPVDVKVRLASCAGQPERTSLDDGFYDIYLETEITTAEGTVVTTYGRLPLVVGDPYVAPTLTTGDPWPTDFGWSTLDTLPACGAEYWGQSSSFDLFRISAHARYDGSSVIADVTGYNTAGYAREAAVGEPILVVMKDGVIVAKTTTRPGAFALADWTEGDSVTRTVSVPAVTCTAIGDLPAGSPLPPGTYGITVFQDLYYLPNLDWTGAIYGGSPLLVIPGAPDPVVTGPEATPTAAPTPEVGPTPLVTGP